MLHQYFFAYLCDMKDLPIGRHDFRMLRQEDLLYVDKTEVIARLLHGGKRWFF